jgi:hypothetical protein
MPGCGRRYARINAAAIIGIVKRRVVVRSFLSSMPGLFNILLKISL